MADTANSTTAIQNEDAPHGDDLKTLLRRAIRDALAAATDFPGGADSLLRLFDTPAPARFVPLVLH